MVTVMATCEHAPERINRAMTLTPSPLPHACAHMRLRCDPAILTRSHGNIGVKLRLCLHPDPSPLSPPQMWSWPESGQKRLFSLQTHWNPCEMKNLAKNVNAPHPLPQNRQTTNCWYFLVNYIIVWPTCIKLYLDCLWANLSGWIMRLIKIQYPFLEKIPLCRERKSCGIEHTEFIEVVNLFISSFICNLEFIS